MVETWVRDDIEEVRETKLRNLFEFFACENPRYLEEDRKLWKQSNGSQERIDVDKIFARAFTPEQFAQMFLELDIDHYYNLKKQSKGQIDPFKNLLRAFDRRIPPSPPEVFADKVREKLLLIRDSKKYPLDQETRAHMASVAIYVDTDSSHRLDLDTYFDGLFFNLALACEGIWDRLHDDDIGVRQAAEQKVFDTISITNVGKLERQFWRGLAEDVIGRLNDGYRTWEGIVQLDPADYITGLAKKLDSRAAKDSVSSAFIFSGIDELLTINPERVLIPVNQSVRLAKIALKEYYQPHGDEVQERLLLSVTSLLTQSNQHRRMAIMDQELNGLLKSAINLNTGEYGPVIKRKPTVAEETAIEILNGLLLKPQ